MRDRLHRGASFARASLSFVIDSRRGDCDGGPRIRANTYYARTLVVYARSRRKTSKARSSQPNRYHHYRDITVTVASLRRLLHRPGVLLNSPPAHLGASFPRELGCIVRCFLSRETVRLTRRGDYRDQIKENRVIAGVSTAGDYTRSSRYFVLRSFFYSVRTRRGNIAVILGIIRPRLRRRADVASLISAFGLNFLSGHTWRVLIAFVAHGFATGRLCLV